MFYIRIRAIGIYIFSLKNALKNAETVPVVAGAYRHHASNSCHNDLLPNISKRHFGLSLDQFCCSVAVGTRLL